MADADAKAPPKSNLDADLIASISPSSTSSGARSAVAIESQFADLAISDELPKPSGWGDDAVGLLEKQRGQRKSTRPGVGGGLAGDGCSVAGT